MTVSPSSSSESIRARLANRRESTTFNFRCNELLYSATVSHFSNDRVAEVFISNAKAGSHFGLSARPLQKGLYSLTRRCRVLGAKRKSSSRSDHYCF